MKVRQFRARTMQEALARVKSEMGREAVLLYTRRYKVGGLFGLFGQEMVEVTAAVNEEAAAAAGPGSVPTLTRIQDFQPTPTPSPAPIATAAPPAITALPSANGATAGNGERGGATLMPFMPRPVPEQRPVADDSDMGTQLETVKEMVSQVIRRLDGGDALNGYPDCLRRMFSSLIGAETEEDLAKEIVVKIADLTKRSEFDNAGAVRILGTYLERMFGKAQPIDCSSSGRRVIALIGPTGVGKTTTIAKLAANFAVIEKKKVALITADTYRIAAVEQLKTYGDIIGVPVDVVFTPKELKLAVEMHRDADLIIIDTAGRSHKNEMQMSELKGFLDAAMPTETYLVVAVNSSLRDAREALRMYGKVGFDRLIFTKLDETSHFGLMLNLTAQVRKPMSYFTTGQSVPDDIEVASPQRIARLILEG